MKAGEVMSGGFSTERAIKEGKACVVIAAADVSDNTRKKFANMCKYYDVPIFFYGSKLELGKAIGKEYRAMMAIVNQGLAKAIIQNINQEVVDIWQK